MPSISTHERYVSTFAGNLYVKSWTPAASSSSSDIAPVVLFHDSLGSVELWRDFPEHLAFSLGRHVIAYDRAGFGRSYARTDKLEADFIINEAHGPFTAICAELGIEDFIAFGHSVGGAMAAVCAATFPDHCVALITEAAQAFVEDRTVEGIRDAEQVFAQDGQINRLKKYHGEKAAWVLRAWTDTWLSEDFQHWTLHETLARVNCPVLAIHGEDDEFGSVAHPELYTSLPAGPCVMELLRACGHVPHRDKPAVVTELVRDFLAQHAH
ncbi:Pimeloyl-ACP methyl ester carboxylesterase [Marinobacter antarcticus]|uniref:Pimeloyl-ACP methyl ester carboxylesterase n=1 Tax=Marinobacter antarcticus TaxID=564117 RepID=A0A1M6UEV8_9GAMM|nr:alpha/beta hydrolase [Marinobacter antarcticus]SHK67736.1 Pimeloyl-ACP methyl ester carboxylesterase [Marinobacter antarcticus]